MLFGICRNIKKCRMKAAKMKRFASTLKEKLWLMILMIFAGINILVSLNDVLAEQLLMIPLKETIVSYFYISNFSNTENINSMYN